MRGPKDSNQLSLNVGEEVVVQQATLFAPRSVYIPYTYPQRAVNKYFEIARFARWSITSTKILGLELWRLGMSDFSMVPKAAATGASYLG